MIEVFAVLIPTRPRTRDSDVYWPSYRPTHSSGSILKNQKVYGELTEML